jgi:hypothetical protein
MSKTLTRLADRKGNESRPVRPEEVTHPTISGAKASKR